MNKLIYVSDLKNLSDLKTPRPFLKCDICGGEYSAHKGDYWAMDYDDPLECCGDPVRRVKRVCIFEEA